MGSEAQSSQAVSHEGDAQEIYTAIVALSRTDLEHFTLPPGITLSHFQIGHASLTDHHRSSWSLTLLVLIPIWFRVFGRKQQPNQEAAANRRASGQSGGSGNFASDSRGQPDVSGGGR